MKDLEALEKDPGYQAFLDSFLTDQFVTPDSLYVDFRLLKDLDVGAAFSLGREQGRLEEIWTLIKAHAEAYRSRTFLDPVHYLRLPFSRDELEARISDPRWAREVYRLSPMTNVPFYLLENLLVNANHSAATEKPGDVTVHLNTWPMQMDADLGGALMAWLGEALKVNVSLFSRAIADIPISDWLAWDEYYLWNAKAFSENDSVMDAMNAFKFSKKRLFTVPCVGHVFDPGKSKEEIDREILFVRSAHELTFSIFRHIDIRDVSPRVERKTDHGRNGQ